MKEFFFNGRECRYDIISNILCKLKILRDKITKINWRLWCCSLLIIYDGLSSKYDIKIIDFANAEYGENEDNTPDFGFLLGIDNLILILSLILKEKHT